VHNMGVGIGGDWRGKMSIRGEGETRRAEIFGAGWSCWVLRFKVVGQRRKKMVKNQANKTPQGKKEAKGSGEEEGQCTVDWGYSGDAGEINGGTGKIRKRQLKVCRVRRRRRRGFGNETFGRAGMCGVCYRGPEKGGTRVSREFLREGWMKTMAYKEGGPGCLKSLAKLTSK